MKWHVNGLHVLMCIYVPMCLYVRYVCLCLMLFSNYRTPSLAPSLPPSVYDFQLQHIMYLYHSNKLCIYLCSPFVLLFFLLFQDFDSNLSPEKFKFSFEHFFILSFNLNFNLNLLNLIF